MREDRGKDPQFSPGSAHFRDRLWRAGIRGWRVARRIGLLARAEPLVWKVAKAIGTPVRTVSGDVTSSQPDGTQLTFPSDYRDARTLIAGLYEPEVTHLIKALLREGMTMVDAGAYVGYHSVFASRLVGDSGRVFAFEPNDVAFKYLTLNLHANHCDNAMPFQKAVSRSTALLNYVSDPAGAESFIGGQVGGATDTLVDGVALDDFFAALGWPPVDLVKLDVEGSERDALEGMRELSQRNPAMKLIMEFNRGTMRRASVTHQDLAGTLALLGFLSSSVIERGAGAINSSELLPTTDAVCNLLLVKA